jgi:hypothetical protein
MATNEATLMNEMHAHHRDREQNAPGPDAHQWPVDRLIEWIRRDLSRWGSIEDHARITFPGGVDEKPRRAHVEIWTDRTHYLITAHEAYATEDVGMRSYLGCVASARKPRAGEDWTRGNDLADGELNPETWHRILADIVSYEIVKVHRIADGAIPVGVAHG